MGNSVDATMLALLATLERRAKKAGEKSLVKSVVARLVAAGADRELIAEISTLGPKRVSTAKMTSAKTSGKPNGKTKTKTKTTRSKRSEPAAFIS